MAEDEKVKEHHGHNEHESEQTLGEAEGQGDLACCSPSQRVGHASATEQQQQWDVCEDGEMVTCQQKREITNSN